MNIHHTPCCAIAILTANDETPILQIKHTLEYLKKESEKSWINMPNIGGERTILCVTTPHEKILENKLIELGFRVAADGLNRRTGYQKGTLKLWIINW